MKKTLVAFLAAVAASAALAEVTVCETTVTLPTYPYSDPDPVPATSEVRYPYCFFNGFSQTSSPKAWKAVILENEKIRITLLPEIGGHVWGAEDKATGRDFIYYNHVVKFRNIGKRGPWCSGGIEWNFGTFGHGSWTASPVPHFVRKNADGSASCFLSELDLTTRTVWQVEVVLKPGADGFSTRTLWSNTSGLTAPYYQWSTAAFHLSPETTFEFPGETYISHGGDGFAWPVDPDGHDRHVYRGNAFGSSTSVHILGDSSFYGIWWPGDDGKPPLGAAHVNHVTQKFGRKLWLWPQSRSGGIWEDLLTDSDGQYTELQSGRAFNQQSQEVSPKNPFRHLGFAPGVTDAFEDEWRIVRDRGEFDRAWNKANYVERPGVTPKDFDWSSAYGHYLKGEQHYLIRQDDKAEAELSAALRVEPYFVPALARLATLACRRGQYARAREYAAKALSVNTYDPEANYADGFAAFCEGRDRIAAERFGIAAFSPEYRVAAFVRAAMIDLRGGRLADAITMAEKALDADRLNLEAVQVKAIALRRSGRTAEAKTLLEDELARRPLNHAARFELNRLDSSSTPFADFLAGEFPQETVQEIGWLYVACGELEAAEGLFARAAEKSLVAAVERAYVLKKLGRAAEADAALAAAEKRSVAFEFPFRRETLDSLGWALEKSSDWKFRYLNAVLLASFGRSAEADRLLDACGDAPDEAPVYLYRASRRDGDAKLADLRKAAKAGDGWRVGAALYQYFAERKNPARALAELKPYLVRPSNNLNILYANALVGDRRPREAIAFLEKTDFLPSEWGDNASCAWVDSWRMIAEEALAKGDRAAAKDAVAKALSFPEHLGAGKPYKINFDYPGTPKQRNAFRAWSEELRRLASEIENKENK